MPAAVMRFLLVMAFLLGTFARSAGRVLTPEQAQAAIQEGSKYQR
jgi:hypothetical protein